MTALSTWNRKAGRAFTLIEMLVVIAIIAALAAFLFPSYQKATEAGKVTKDVSNLRQIGSAIFLYANDADYIPGAPWPSMLAPNYLSDPRILHSPFDVRPAQLPDGSNPVSYDVNSHLWGLSLLKIYSPSECILVAPLTSDKRTLGFVSTTKEPGLPVPLNREANGRGATGGTCASGARIPVVYADGHAGIIDMTTFHSESPNAPDGSTSRDTRWNK